MLFFLFLNNVFRPVRKLVMLSIVFLTIFFIQFGSNLCRQVVCIPVDTNCAPLVAGMFCFVVRETFDSDWADVIESFGSSSGFLVVCLVLIILIWNKW